MLKNKKANGFGRLWLLPVLLLAGCATLGEVGLVAPTLEFQRFGSTAISPEGIRFVVVMNLINHMPISLPLDRMDYQFDLNGKGFMSGSFNQFKAFGARSRQEVNFPFMLPWEALARHALKRETSPNYSVKFYGTLRLMGDYPFARIPFEIQEDFPVPSLPVITLAGTQGTPLVDRFVIKFKVKNKNKFPISVKTVDAGVTLNRKRYDLANAASVEVGAGETQLLELAMNDTMSTGISMLANVLVSGKLDYQVGGQVSFQTPFGDMTLPLEVGGKTK